MNDSTTPERDDLLVAELRDAFETMAAAYEPRRLPDDLWARGRREGRRTRLQLVAASAVLLALVVATLAWGRSGTVGPAEAPGKGALPAVVHVPTSEQVAGMEADGLVSRTLDVGRLSVTAMLGNRYVLGVGARDGQHVLLDLPDLDPTTATGSQAVTLSPDGQHLAWPYVDPTAPDGESSGVQVVDLATGEVTGYPLTGPGGLPVRVTATSWSPDGSYVGLTGTEYTPADGTEGERVAAAVEQGSEAAGRTVATETGWMPVVAVEDDGTLHLLSAEAGHTRLEPGADAVVAMGLLGEYSEPLGAAVAPDGRRLAVGVHADQVFTSMDLPTGPDEGEWRDRSWDVDLDDPFMYMTVVRGWTPAGSVIGLVPAADGTLWAHRLETDGSTEAVVEVRRADEGSFGQTTVAMATDLGDATPVEFATPDWATTLVQRAAPWLGVLAVLAAGGTVLLVRRRWVRATTGPAAGEPLWAAGRPSLRDRPAAPRTRRLAPGAFARVASTLVTVALAANLASTTAPLMPRADGPVADEGALPTHVHAPTGWVGENSESAAVDPDAPTGPLSVVTHDAWRMHVAVSSTDGAHLIVPPYDDTMVGRDDFTPQLSPDGNQLAVQWSRPGQETTRTAAGLAVVDLRTGDSRRVPLRGANDRPVRVEQVSWAPDGSHFAWMGDEAVQWDTGGSSFKGERRVIGITRADDLRDTSWTVEKAVASAAVAAGPDGTGYLLLRRRLWTFSTDSPDVAPTSRTVSPTALEWSGAAVSGDGRTLAVGHDSSTAHVSGLRLLDLTRGDAQTEPRAWEQRDPVVHTHALGFTPQGRLIVSGQSAGEQMVGDTMVAVVDLQDETGPQVVTTVESADPRVVSVATALADRDPVAFAPPRWPTSTERKLMAGFLTVGLLLSLGLTVRLWRRRPRRGRTA